MAKPSNFWAIIIAIGLGIGLLLGLKSDLEAIPPDFGARCYQAYDALWEEAVQSKASTLARASRLKSLLRQAARAFSSASTVVRVPAPARSVGSTGTTTRAAS